MSREREIPERAADVSGSPGKSILSPIHLSEVMGIANGKRATEAALPLLNPAPHAFLSKIYGAVIAANVAKLPELVRRKG